VQKANAEVSPSTFNGNAPLLSSNNHMIAQTFGVVPNNSLHLRMPVVEQLPSYSALLFWLIICFPANQKATSTINWSVFTASLNRS